MFLTPIPFITKTNCCVLQPSKNKSCWTGPLRSIKYFNLSLVERSKISMNFQPKCIKDGIVDADGTGFPGCVINIGSLIKKCFLETD